MKALLSLAGFTKVIDIYDIDGQPPRVWHVPLIRKLTIGSQNVEDFTAQVLHFNLLTVDMIGPERVAFYELASHIEVKRGDHHD